MSVEMPTERADTARRAPRRARRVELLLGGLAVAGGLAGGVFGLAAPRQVEAHMRAQIDHVLPFPSWEANQEVARFARALRSSDSTSAAAEKAGTSAGDMTDISTGTDSNTSLVEVRFVTENADKADVMMAALVDATLQRLADSDAVPKQALVDELQPQVDALDAKILALTNKGGAAPGSNVIDLYNRNSFDLDSARAEQKFANEKWRIDQLQAMVATLQPRVDALKPVLDEWNTLNNQRDELTARLRTAKQDLQQIEIGKRVLDSGGYRSAVELVGVSRRTSVGRNAAAGAAIGIAIGLLVNLVTMTRQRRRPAA